MAEEDKIRAPSINQDESAIQDVEPVDGQEISVSERNSMSKALNMNGNSSNDKISACIKSIRDSTIRCGSTAENSIANMAENSPRHSSCSPGDYSENEKRPEIFSSFTQELLCISILALGPLLGNVNIGALQVALPKMSEDFGVRGGSLSWSLAAFTLSNGAFLLIMGGICDAFSRKWVLLGSLLLYAILCLISGFVRNFIGFCVLRGLQGMVGSAAIPSSIGILGFVYKPGIRKNRVMATVAGGAPVGFVSGIIAGGISCEFLSWRAIMFFQAIIFTVGAIGTFFFVPADFTASKKDIIKIAKSMDYGGMVLVLAGLLLVSFPLTQAESAPKGWATPYIIVLLVLGILLCALFCVYETYIPKNPLLPMSIWKYPGFGLCMAISSLGWMSFVGITIYYATQYFQDVERISSILATAYFMPLAIGGISVNVLAALLLHRVSGTLLMIIGMLGYLAAALLYAFMPLYGSYWAFPFPAMLGSVLGSDFCYNVGTLHSLKSVPKRLQSTAASLFNTNLQLSITIALAVSSAIVGAIVPDQYSASDAELLRGYHGAFYFAVGLSGLGLFLSFFLRVGQQTADEHDDIIEDEEGKKTETNLSNPGAV